MCGGSPAIWLLNGTGNFLLRVIGMEPESGHKQTLSVNELRMLVSASAESGHVDSSEEEMVQAVFDLGELHVRQVMVPRTEVVSVPSETGLEGLIEVFARDGFA